MKRSALLAAALALMVTAPALAQDSKTSGDTSETKAEEQAVVTQPGTCEEAKSQQTYWCEERESISVVSFGMECENAKKNVAEACHGEKTEVPTYK